MSDLMKIGQSYYSAGKRGNKYIKQYISAAPPKGNYQAIEDTRIEPTTVQAALRELGMSKEIAENPAVVSHVVVRAGEHHKQRIEGAVAESFKSGRRQGWFEGAVAAVVAGLSILGIYYAVSRAAKGA